MKKTKIMALLLSATLVFSGCGNMNNTAKGGCLLYTSDAADE